MVAYHRPTTLAEALAIRAGGDVTVLAGGTDVYPARTTRAGWGHVRHKDVLDISAIAALRGIADKGDHWRLGAMTTWSDLIAADLPPCFAGYRQAARAVGGRQVQNRATLVGNLCTASPAGDGIPNLLVLDARIELAGPQGTRQVPAADFIDGYRHTVCGADEIVTAIIVPKQENARSAFLKLGARSYLVISIVMVAGLIEHAADGRIAQARIAIGACAERALRLPGLEAALKALPPGADPREALRGEHLDAISPIDDVRASAAYRRAAALALTRDLLAGLASPTLRRAA